MVYHGHPSEPFSSSSFAVKTRLSRSSSPSSLIAAADGREVGALDDEDVFDKLPLRSAGLTTGGGVLDAADDVDSDPSPPAVQWLTIGSCGKLRILRRALS